MPARVMLIGLDAVDPTLARELAASGELPTLAALLEASPVQRVVNPDAVFVSAVWPTLYTGASPGVHGRVWPGLLHPHSYQIRPFEWSGLGAEPMWETFARAGHRVAVIDAPHAKAVDVPGLTQLADWGGHEPAHGFHASSSALEADVRARHGVHPVDNCDHYAKRGDLDQLVADMRDGIDRKTALSVDFATNTDWDLFFTVFTEAHCAGHQCWHVHDTGHPAHDPGQRDALGDPVADVYRRIDGALGELLACADGDTEVFVVLSHGMGARHEGSSLVNEMLRRLEAEWDREPSRWAVGRDRAAHAWNRVARKAGLRPEKTWMLDGSHAFIRAPNARLCTAIRINRKGREPAGSVRADEYEQVCDALVAEFLALENVDTGHRAVKRVLRATDLFEGPAVDGMADLFVEWRQDEPIRSVASPTVGVIEGRNGGGYDDHRTGDHRRDGLLLRQGPSVDPARAGVDDVIDARDVVPMISTALGAPLAAADR